MLLVILYFEKFSYYTLKSAQSKSLVIWRHNAATG